MDELELLRQKRMQEIAAAQQQENELAHQVSQLESIVRTLLTKKALERFGNIKAAHPETAVKVLAVIGQAIQKGKISKIDDAGLKEILKKNF